MENHKKSLNALLKISHVNRRQDLQDERVYLRKRYLVAGLMFVGWAILYVLRINLSISLVDMTSNKLITIGNETVLQPAEFNWTSTEKGTILSAFSWGICASPIGAVVASKIGGINTFGGGVALTGLITLFSPFLMQWNLSIYLIVRVLEGIFEGFSVTSSVDIFVQWSPPNERSRLLAGTFLGTVFGTMLSYPLCGMIAYHFSWRAVFYFTGGISLVWYIIWVTLTRNTPAEDKFMTQAERKYLIEVNESVCKEKITYPWRRILTSKPVWAFINDCFVESWSLSFLTYCLPIYIKDLQDENIQNIGFISGIPHVCAVVGLAGGAILADFLRNRHWLSITNVHRLYLLFAQSTAVVLLITMAIWRNSLISIICLSLYRLFFTISDVSYMVLPVDLGGRYAGFILGIAMMSVSFGFTLNPLVMGLMVTNHSVAEWSRYFLLLSGFNVWGGIIFYMYGSGELQPWATSEKSAETIEEHRK